MCCFVCRIYNVFYSSSPGEDHSNPESNMFPQDAVAMVGDNTTVCCIIGEGKEFGSIRANNMTMKVVRLSRRSYITTSINQAASTWSGTNMVCNSNMKLMVAGTVVFVGCK